MKSPETVKPDPKLVPMELLSQLIEAGWGDVPRTKIPEDWRTRKPPTVFHPTITRTNK